MNSRRLAEEIHVLDARDPDVFAAFNDGYEAGIARREDCPYPDDTRRAFAWWKGHRKGLEAAA
jgi:ribosome modulation factor